MLAFSFSSYDLKCTLKLRSTFFIFHLNKAPKKLLKMLFFFHRKCAFCFRAIQIFVIVLFLIQQLCKHFKRIVMMPWKGLHKKLILIFQITQKLLWTTGWKSTRLWVTKEKTSEHIWQPKKELVTSSRTLLFFRF